MDHLDLKSSIIWEDDALLVVNKPPGAAAAPFPGITESTVKDLVASHLSHKGISGGGLAYRLKPWVSGALLWIKSEESLLEFQDHMAEGEAFIVLICVVAGGPGGYEGELPHGAGRWVALKDFSGYTILEIRPAAGAWEDEVALSLTRMGTPLVGPDGVYPDQREPFARRFAHCQRVEFPHPLNQGSRASFVAPFPQDMKAGLAALSGP